MIKKFFSNKTHTFSFPLFPFSYQKNVRALVVNKDVRFQQLKMKSRRYETTVSEPAFSISNEQAFTLIKEHVQVGCYIQTLPRE